jgi:hypothetical protein
MLRPATLPPSSAAPSLSLHNLLSLSPSISLGSTGIGSTSTTDVLQVEGVRFQMRSTCNDAHVVLLIARNVGRVQKLGAARAGEVVPPAPSALRLPNFFRGAPSVIDK